MLVVAVDKSPDEAALAACLKTALERPLGTADYVCLLLASKMLAGLPYGIGTKDPEIVRRARSLAADLGARVEDFTEDDGAVSMAISSPRGDLGEIHAAHQILIGRWKRA